MLVTAVVAPVPECLFQRDTKHFKCHSYYPTVTVWNRYSYCCSCSFVHEASENPRGPVTRQWYSLRSCGLTPEVTPFLLISINIWRVLFKRLVSVYNVSKFKIYMWNQPDYCCQSLLTRSASPDGTVWSFYYIVWVSAWYVWILSFGKYKLCIHYRLYLY